MVDTSTNYFFFWGMGGGQEFNRNIIYLLTPKENGICHKI